MRKYHTGHSPRIGEDGEAQPLTGLRVIDMTTLAMGPLATQLLGDYGAEVIKVEPLAGDPFRQTLPMRSSGMGHVFLQLNRNKKSLAIDLKAPGAKAAFRKLLATADILVSNVRPAGMKGLGLDYESVKATNPALIYCIAGGFSEQGPYAGRPAADDVIQAMSGLVDLQGQATGTPNLIATIVADKAAGLTLATAIMAAIIRRMKTGEGDCIELPMFETMVAFVMPEHVAGLTYDPPLGKAGYGRIMNPERRPYATRDGLLSVLPYTAAQWQRFFRLIGRHDLADDPDLAAPARRNARLEEFYGHVAAAMPNRTTKQWMADLLAADIMFGEVLSPEDLVRDPHLEAVGLFTFVDHPTEGRIRLMRPPVWSASRSARLSRLPPTLGQDSRAVLARAGMEAGAVEALIAEGSVLAA